MAIGRVLVVDDTKLIGNLINEKFGSMGYDVCQAADGEDALKKLRSFHPDLIILDVMLPGMSGYEVTRAIRRDPIHSRVPIILLTAKSSLDAKTAGFDAGADDYITKPFDPTELELRARALLSRARTSLSNDTTADGKIVSVFSLRGGSGATSIAVNLSVALAGILEQEIALLDLSLETAGAGILLDLLPRLTLSNLAKEEPSSIDATLLKEYLASHRSGVKLLPAPASPFMAELVTPSLANLVATRLRQNYSHVIVDAPHNLSELTLAVLDLSDIILMVVPPEMLSLKAAAGALETFASLGYPESRTAVLVNWTFAKGGLPIKQVESALSRTALAVLPFEPEAIIRAINDGTPAIIRQPTMPWSKALESLAFRIATPESKAQAEAAGSKRISQLKKRLAA